jgi:hypothetical protein
MPRFNPALPLAVFLLSTVSLSASAVGVWAQTTPPAQSLQKVASPGPTAALLPGDPAVRSGVLPNGMHYQILRNATPKGQAALRLRIGSGSLEESDPQQGLAHFLEHMAFKGTTVRQCFGVEVEREREENGRRGLPLDAPQPTQFISLSPATRAPWNKKSRTWAVT